MPLYGLLPRTYMEKPARIPQTSGNQASEIQNNEAIAHPGDAESAKPYLNKPLPKLPSIAERRGQNACNGLCLVKDTFNCRTEPTDAGKVSTASAESLLHYFDDILPYSDEIASPRAEVARSSSLRPMPSSPTLRRRHLPRIRTRPLSPRYDSHVTETHSHLIVSSSVGPPPQRPLPPLPTSHLRRSASFGPGPALATPTKRLASTSTSTGPAGTGLRILKRSDARRPPSQPLPRATDLSFLPVVPVDLSLYLEVPLVDHAAFERGERAVRKGAGSSFPVLMPARKPCTARAEQCWEEPAPEPEQDEMRQLRRKAGFSRLRVDQVDADRR